MMAKLAKIVQIVAWIFYTKQYMLYIQKFAFLFRKIQKQLDSVFIV